MSNYYISIMTCIFLVMYFVGLLVLEEHMTRKRLLTSFLQFTVYSLLAGGLAAVALVPEIYALRMTTSGDFNFPELLSEYFSIFDMLARHIGNVETETGLDHWPNIYCGVAVLMFFLLYLAQRRISGKEKAVYCTFLLIFLASFSINILNYIWHGFHFPNSLPARQSYIYIFLMLFVCYRAYMYLKETAWKHVVLAFWGAVTFVILAQKLVTDVDFYFIVYYAAFLFLGLYLWAVWLYQKGPYYRNMAIFFALAVVSVEAAVNTAVTSVTTSSRTEYTKDNEAVKRLAELAEARGTFFRMEKIKRKTKNDGAWMNFPSASLFSSTANADLSKLFKKLGCESSTNAYSITGSTPLIDTLFAVRYALYSREPEPSKLRAFLAQEEDTLLYENTYTLPLGFWVASDFEERWDLETGNPADVQNSLADSLQAVPVMTAVNDVQNRENETTCYPEEDGEYYAYVGNKDVKKVTYSSLNGTKTFDNVNRGYLLELGYCRAGEEISLTVEDTDANKSLRAQVYRFSEEGLADVYEKLSAAPWELIKWTDTELEGTIFCTDGGLMMTTIPYDKGWTVLVNGQEQTAVKMLDAFIGVRLGPGVHTISMNYAPEGLSQGWIITIGSGGLLLLIGAGGYEFRRRRQKLEESRERESQKETESRERESQKETESRQETELHAQG